VKSSAKLLLVVEGGSSSSEFSLFFFLFFLVSFSPSEVFLLGLEGFFSGGSSPLI